MLLLAVACVAPPNPGASKDSAAPAAEEVAWSAVRARLDGRSDGGRDWRRAIVHLHSPWSHDACDGEPLVDGVPREDCLASLRNALCDAAIDVAFLTDHPAHAAYQPWEALLLQRDGDVRMDGASQLGCADGTTVTWLPGIEDVLMPVGLDRHAAGDDAPEENDRLYNDDGAESIDAEIAAGGLVLQAHTESQSLDRLLERQARGLAGVEMFNLHAMVDPDLREEGLGLDGYDWLAAISPWVTGTTDAEPDLVILAFYQQQDPSIERWDALAAVAPTVATAGTDAHENAIPSPMSDGERVDSYRRMMSWFSNVLLVDADTPASAQEALAAGRSFIAFDALGVPGDWQVRYGELEMGGAGTVGEELSVSCPTLAPSSPRGPVSPEVEVTIYKDGAAWEEGCGSWTLGEPGVYRAVATITPHHLRPFLDDQADALVRPTPWLYSNAFRVE